MRKFAKSLLFSVLLGTAATSVQAQTVIFDSKALSEATPGVFEYPENRPSGFNYGLVTAFSNDTTVNQLGIWTSVDQEQDIKFLIFDSYVGGGSGALLFSQTKHFGQNGTQGWIYSDGFNFTFQGGHTYDIGILGNGDSLTGEWNCCTSVSQNGITGVAHNANFDTFSNPETDPNDYASVVPYVQLVQNGAVPEPASWALMLGGFGMVGGALRSRRKVAVRFA